jgi:hypothetical protein
MAKLPAPPSPLAVPAEVVMLPAGQRLWRVYFAGGAHPTAWSGLRFFGPTHARFDHHDPPPHLQGRGIFYGAGEPATCLAEVFQAARTIDRRANAPWLVGFELAGPVRLLTLLRTWPTRAGASMAINSGPRARARLWSRAIYDAYPDVQGLLYASCMHANKRSVALYERARGAIPATPVFHRALADPTILRRLGAAATRLGYRLV